MTRSLGRISSPLFRSVRARPGPQTLLVRARSHAFWAQQHTDTGATVSHLSCRRNARSFGGILFVASAVLGVGYLTPTQSVYAEEPASEAKSNGRLIRMSEVKKHDSDAERKWVIRGTRVYDITDWIPGHPGGDVILRAVGSNIDPYWDIFAIHKKKDVYDILESYYIGNIDPRDLEDGKVPIDDLDDPFKNDPSRDQALVVHTEKPCNAESPTESLATFITPNNHFYVRQHLWVPPCNEPGAHQLTIELPDGTEASYTLAQLKSKFEPVTITATLQCSGNRRAHMTVEARSAQGLQWDIGAISNAEWTGVRLRDVLQDAGFSVNDYDPNNVKHVQFTGAEAYGSSIPIDKAVDRFGDVLLAHTMNGQPIPPDHGYPLRLLAPGIVAARSVKWLSKIVLSDEESSSQWQQRDYKCFGPNQTSSTVDWSSAPAIQDMPVQSAITSLKKVSCSAPADRKRLSVYGLEEDAVEVEGYAYSGGGRRIIRVDVSADDGKNWHQATILPDHTLGSKAWAWARWRWVIPRSMAGRVFICKAVDDGYNTQPENYDGEWNFRGNLTRSWHRVGFSNRED